MRQAAFAVVLIAAAFLGGAAVNGPGVKWVQARLLDYMGIKDGGEIASIDAPRAPDEAANQPLAGPAAAAGGLGTAPETPRKTGLAQEAKPAEPVAGAPAATPPSGGNSLKNGLVGFLNGLGGNSAKTPAVGKASPENAPAAATAVPRASDPNPSSTRGPAGSEPESATGRSGKIRRVAAAQNSDAPGEALRLAPAPQAATPAASPTPADPSASPAPLDPDIGAALLAARSPAGEPQSAPSRERDPGGSIPLEVAPAGSAEGSATTSRAAGKADAALGRASTGELQDWPGIRHKLRSLGVSRYVIEGQPDGRVNFSCLIPLAGRQAVSQRFEAEAEDEFQAAKAAIRRIALWRAAHPSAAPSP